MRTTPLYRVHYMKLGASRAYCGTLSQQVRIAYDEWEPVTCSECRRVGHAPGRIGAGSDRGHELVVPLSPDARMEES